MKTPAQIADEVMHGEGRFNFGPAESVVASMIQEAIEADRAQPERDGTIHAAVIEALRDRADGDLDHAAPCERAIKWIEHDPDGFWEQHAGPMLDEIEADFTLDEEITA